MIQLCKWSEDIQILFLSDTQTEIHIIKSHRKRFIESAKCIIKALSNHQTCTSHCGYILCITQSPHITKIVIVDFIVCVPCRSMCAKSNHYPCMLNCSIAIIKLCADGSHVRALGVHQHRLHPIHRNYLRIII